jgi:hypothetical protein
MRIDIRTNFPEVAQAMARLRADIARQATARALNRVAEAARTDMSREIRREFNLTAGYVRQRLSVRRASANSALRLTAELRGGDGKKRSANVIAFQARQTGKGVAVKIKREGGRKVITNAFIANQGRTVFIRTGAKRLPIVAVQTIDVPQMFNTQRIQRAVVAAIERKFPALWAREAAYYLRRAGL